MSARQQKSSDPKLDMKAVARRIREIRGFDLTQAELARKLGISQAQFSKYEKGLSQPTAEILLKLKAISGKSIDWILTGKDAAQEEDKS